MYAGKQALHKLQNWVSGFNPYQVPHHDALEASAASYVPDQIKQCYATAYLAASASLLSASTVLSPFNRLGLEAPTY